LGHPVHNNYQVPQENIQRRKMQPTQQKKEKENNQKKIMKKTRKNTTDINITQMMVGKQWVKSWGIYR